MHGARALFAVILVSAATLAGCAPGTMPQMPGNTNSTNTKVTADGPSIEVSPTTDDAGKWKVASADTVKVSVTAPGADSVTLLYRPVFADEGDYLKLKTAPAGDKASGKFAADMKLPNDFAGDVWAEASYTNGGTKRTDAIALRRAPAKADETAEAPPAETNGKTAKSSPEVSARSDSVTGGKIEKAQIAANNPDLRITINVPAFQLTLWQSGKEVQTYPIAIGRKEYPLPSGNRVARQMILNPDWVPPDSDWVREAKVEPGEPIEAGDPKNPLGDVKIPLGDGILIHEAAKKADLGRLVSHGCARMIQADIVDLVDKIATAQGLGVTKTEINKVIAGNDRKDITLKKPVPVEIAYDTAVVEGGKLRLYPDVDDEKTATADAVRKELEASGVDVAKLDEKTIDGMLEKVDPAKAYVISVADIEAGKGLAAGKTEPVVISSSSSTGPAKGKRS